MEGTLLGLHATVMHFSLTSRLTTNSTLKQAGNGPSRRHIQGSKIAKVPQSVKYSLLQYPHEETIEKIFFQLFFGPVSRIAPKNVKEDLKKA